MCVEAILPRRRESSAGPFLQLSSQVAPFVVALVRDPSQPPRSQPPGSLCSHQREWGPGRDGKANSPRGMRHPESFRWDRPNAASIKVFGRCVALRRPDIHAPHPPKFAFATQVAPRSLQKSELLERENSALSTPPGHVTARNSGGFGTDQDGNSNSLGVRSGRFRELWCSMVNRKRGACR